MERERNVDGNETRERHGDEAKTSYQRVFHGTDALGIEQTGFRLQMIGSGEGSQSFGWGIYATGRQELGDYYREELARRSPPNFVWRGKRYEGGTPEHEALRRVHRDGLAKAKQSLAANREASEAPRTPGDRRVWEYWERVRDFMNAMDEEQVQEARGQLYSLSIPPDDDLLDWDKPVPEQSERVRTALGLRMVADGVESAPFEIEIDAPLPNGGRLRAPVSDGFRSAGEAMAAMETLTGAQMYLRLARTSQPEGASRMLRKIGIPGLRYLDGVSRSAGEGSANYVIWDEALLTPDIAHITPLSPRRREDVEDDHATARIMAQYTDHPNAPSEAEIRAALEDFHETERTYGGRDGYDRARVAGRTHLTYAQWVQVRTQHFRRWFGDWQEAHAAVEPPGSVSGVLHPETGEPLVVYHGSGYDLGDRFRKSVERNKNHRSPVFFFTNDTDMAAGYADSSPRTFDRFGNGVGQNLTPVFLAIRRPVRITGDGATGLGVLLDDDAIAQAMRDGQDGVVATNVIDAPDAGRMRSHDVFIAFESAQAKSAIANVGMFSERSEIMFSRNPFYSALLTSVRQAKGAPRRAPAVQWQQWLDGAQRRGEFKRGERDWIGLDAWLEASEGDISRKDVVDFVRVNQVRIDDVMLSEEGADAQHRERKEALDHLKEQIDLAKQYIREVVGAAHVHSISGTLYGFGPRERAAATAHLSDAEGRRLVKLEREQERLEMVASYVRRTPYAPVPQFGQYTLPGGSKYHELLLTLPGERTDPSTSMTREELAAWYEEEIGYNPVEDDPGITTDALRDLVEEAHSVALRVGSTVRSRVTEKYRDRHYQRADLLAHVRFNERTNAHGKRILFVEEVQSGWHQEGRRLGYRSEHARGPIVEDKTDTQVLVNGGWTHRSILEEAGADFDRLGIGDRVPELADPSRGVPDAPFTKEWPLLVMKRIVRYAAEHGYDEIAWTPGEMQAARYALTHHVDRIEVASEFDPMSGETSRTVSLHCRDDPTTRLGVGNDGVVHTVNASAPSELQGKPLDHVVGKELAKRILAVQGNQTFSGEGLAVGGEGLRAFYDEILPATMNRWAKPFGVRVGTTDIVTEGLLSDDPDSTPISDDGDVTRPVHSLAVTPEMRASALAGQPMFSKGAQGAAASGAREHSEPTAETEQLSRRLSDYHGASVRIEALRTVPEDLAPLFAEFQRVFDTRVHMVRNLTPEACDFEGVSLRDGQLFVNEAARSPAVTIISHEMVHQLRKDRPDLYEELAEEVRRQGDIAGYLERLRAREANSLGDPAAIGLMIAEEELVADLAGDAMSDPAFLESLARRNRPLFGRLASYFGGFLDRLRSAFGDLPEHASKAYVQDVDTFRALLGDVVERYAAESAQPEIPAEPPFYSTLLRAVNAAEGAPRQASARAWQQWLDGAQRRGLIRQAERQWTGVDAWLAGRETTTREDLQTFVARHAIQIDEKWLEGSDRTGYASQQLEGGHRYRELLLMLPPPNVVVFDPDKLDIRRQRFTSTEGGLATLYYDGRQIGGPYGDTTDAPPWQQPETHWIEQAKRVHQAGWITASGRRMSPQWPGAFLSAHFKEPNILVWVRMNDREGPHGERFLHIEEIQSDWHQSGRRRGYGREATRDEVAREVYSANYAELDTTTQWAVDVEVDGRNNGTGGAAPTTSGVVPESPFKNDWAALALKRILRAAAEEGYDGVTWTDGDRQVARYSLDKTLRSVFARRVESVDAYGKALPLYELTVEGPLETLYDSGGYPLRADQLAEHVGRDLAKRIVTEADKKGITLEGRDRMVGGEGMRTFYDGIVPATANDLVKPWGGKVGTTHIKAGDTIVPAPCLPLTPAMRLAVLEGLPMFSRPEPGPAPDPSHVVRENLARIQSAPAARPGRGRPLMHGRVRTKHPGTSEKAGEAPRTIDEWKAALERRGVRILGITRQATAAGGEVTVIDLGAGCSVRDAGNTLLATRDSAREIACMIALAQEKGWKEVTVSGSRRFQKEAANAFAAAGLAVEGHAAPTDTASDNAPNEETVAEPSDARAEPVPALRTREVRPVGEQYLTFDANSVAIALVESRQACWCCDEETPVFALEVDGVAELRGGWLDSERAGSVGGPLRWVQELNGDAMEAISALGANWQHRKTDAMEDCAYYANVCPHCDAVQGDHFLHDEGGAFAMDSLRPVKVHRISAPVRVAALELIEYPEDERLCDRPAADESAPRPRRFGM